MVRPAIEICFAREPQLGERFFSGWAVFVCQNQRHSRCVSIIYRRIWLDAEISLTGKSESFLNSKPGTHVRTDSFFIQVNRFVRQILIAASLLVGPVLLAGTESYDYKQAPPTITESAPWQFTIAVPGWLASTNGTIGIHGVNADIDVPITDVLQHFERDFGGASRGTKRSLRNIQ